MPSHYNIQRTDATGTYWANSRIWKLYQSQRFGVNPRNLTRKQLRKIKRYSNKNW